MFDELCSSEEQVSSFRDEEGMLKVLYLDSSGSGSVSGLTHKLIFLCLEELTL